MAVAVLIQAGWWSQFIINIIIINTTCRPTDGAVVKRWWQNSSQPVTVPQVGNWVAVLFLVISHASGVKTTASRNKTWWLNKHFPLLVAIHYYCCGLRCITKFGPQAISKRNWYMRSSLVHNFVSKHSWNRIWPLYIVSDNLAHCTIHQKKLVRFCPPRLFQVSLSRLFGQSH